MSSLCQCTLLMQGTQYLQQYPTSNLVMAHLYRINRLSLQSITYAHAGKKKLCLLMRS